MDEQQQHRKKQRTIKVRVRDGEEKHVQVIEVRRPRRPMAAPPPVRLR
jgi:hypothetical protein